MNEDHITEPPILTRAGWFFWRNWNRVVCTTRGHDRNESACCRRCGLPPRTEDL